ncbi:MAG: methyltransferase domain-containing protein [bacterium]|nr:methyltransferase domain-containing protein [bacterium]
MNEPLDPNFKASQFWDQRYAAGGDSGSGSKGVLGQFKSAYVTAVIRHFQIKSIVDFGCGDGTQVAQLPVEQYYGLDVSPSVVERCRAMYADRPGFRFDALPEATLERYDMAMSLDVLYHVVEPDEYEAYLRRAFGHSTYTLFYINREAQPSTAPHILFRDHLSEIKQRGFATRLIEQEQNPHKPSMSFFLFHNQPSAE